MLNLLSYKMGTWLPPSVGYGKDPVSNSWEEHMVVLYPGQSYLCLRVLELIPNTTF